jgi:hypothetical protein
MEPSGTDWNTQLLKAAYNHSTTFASIKSILIPSLPVRKGNLLGMAFISNLKSLNKKARGSTRPYATCSVFEGKVDSRQRFILQYSATLRCDRDGAEHLHVIAAVVLKNFV